MSTNHAAGETRAFALSCIRAGAVTMLLGVVLGAFGAHALQQVLTLKQLASYQTGVLYQQLHSLALILVGVVALVTPATRWLPRAAVLFGAGIFFFSGSIYAMTFGAPRWLGMIAPVGGVSFMLGWLTLALHAVKGTGVSDSD
jgi:uncharacterized membrane protein YgdD (TMEM256/DUF423 family)